MARRIGGRGGGSDKGDGGATTLLIAAGLAVALGVGGASTVGLGGFGSGASGSASRGQSSVGNRNSDNAEARIVARVGRVTSRVSDDSDDCAAHAYGQVQEFLRENPCVGMHRALFEIRDARGDVVLIAISWVEMADESTARRLHDLVDGSGTGNVTELSRERGRYRTVRFTGDFYASRRDGLVVSNAQAQPVARGVTGLALTTIVNEALA